MSQFERYHLTIAGKRTTVSMDKFLSDLLTLSLGEPLGGKHSHRTVRLWMDKSISEWAAFDPELPVSHQVTRLALEQIANPVLVERYFAAVLERNGG